MGERNTLFESMWNQELLGNYEREPGSDDDEKPRARSIADAIADIHRATLSALIEISRPLPPLPDVIGEPAPFVHPYARSHGVVDARTGHGGCSHGVSLLDYCPVCRNTGERDECIHRNCPICRKVAETEDDATVPPSRPRRCTVCGSAITLRNGIFYSDANGIMCRACSAARGDVPPALQPIPPSAIDPHANDGVLADDHDSMLDEPEVAAPGLGSLDGSGSLDEHAMASLDEQAAGERTSTSQPSEIPAPGLSRDLKG